MLAMCVLDVARPRPPGAGSRTAAGSPGVAAMSDLASGRAPGPAESPRFPAGTRALVKALHLSRRLRGRHRYDDFLIERVHGVPILVTPTVFNPKRLRTGEFFASRLDATLIEGNADVLDMGTGSGVCAVFAAGYARRVVAVDINAAAVRCAGINAALNLLEDKIDVRHGISLSPSGSSVSISFSSIRRSFAVSRAMIGIEPGGRMASPSALPTASTAISNARAARSCCCQPMLMRRFFWRR